MDSTIWRETEAWEREHSNEGDLWTSDTEDNHALVERALAIHARDPRAALEFHREAADGGSVWAMEMIGWFYDKGCGVPADLEKAAQAYRRAIDAGSQMATIRLARLLARRGDYRLAEQVLEDGMRAYFIPAVFWTAWYRYKQHPTRDTARAVEPLLERAANAGHPNAKVVLARWRASGLFGPKQIARGWRSLRELAALAAKG